MTLQQLATVLNNVIGVRGGANQAQAPTAAVGWRENWNVLFVAIQNAPASGYAGNLVYQASLQRGGQVPHWVDARAAANDYYYMRNGLQTASAHAEMLVLMGILRFRVDRASAKPQVALDQLNNVPGRQGIFANPNAVLQKYTQNYIQNRFNNRRDVNTLHAKFSVQGRRVRIVSNAETCYFCANMMTQLGIEWGALNNQAALIQTRGARPLTGWWNPINDYTYGHGTQEWGNQIPGL